MSSRSFISAFMAIALSMFAVMAVNAQEASAPAPALTSDGYAIDQGIAYTLMFVALLLTYFLH